MATLSQCSHFFRRNRLNYRFILCNERLYTKNKDVTIGIFYFWGKCKISHTVFYIKYIKHITIEKCVLCCVCTCQSCIATILLKCRDYKKGVVSIMKFEMHTKNYFK